MTPQALAFVVPAATTVVPYEKFLVPVELNGGRGRYRAAKDLCLLAADNDHAAIGAWLYSKACAIPVAPKTLPDLKRGAALFQAQCASCHGTAGGGDGPLAAQLDPPPIAFTDRERARSRSLMAPYQVVSQGVTGTSMPSFSTLSDEDRWALAFFAGTLSYDSSMRERGEQQWKQDPAARKAFPNLAAVTTTTEAAAAGKIAPDAAGDITAFLRSQPNAASAAGNATRL